MGISLVQQPHDPLEAILSRLKGVRKSLRGWVACCPAHSDREPSLSLGLGDNGHILLKCFAGCSLENIVEAIGMAVTDLFPNVSPSSTSQASHTQRSTLSLIDLALDKMLPWQFLFHLGVTENTAGDIEILYHLPDGTPAPRHRLRTALVAREGSRWSEGKGEIVAYGLERLEEARKAGYLVVVEGESDCWTLWYHHFPALGLPGAEMVSKLEETSLAGIERVYIVQEPDAAGTKFVKQIEQRLQSWHWTGKAYVVSLSGAKDPNDLHKHERKGFKTAFQQALDRAEPLFIRRAQPIPPSCTSKPAPFTLQELLARELPPVRWAIPDILPEGLTLLAGKPKMGKSWLALSIALAVASGGVALGKQPVTQGEVLYLALEDNERRLQSRAKQLLASMTSVPHGMECALSWPRLDQGGLNHLEAYLQAHPGVRLVVVDTWAKISPQTNKCRRSQYEGEYEALSSLKTLADTYRVAIVAVHHLRKMRADDVLDEITGSIGMTGAVDGALILKRERGQAAATLFVTGRDIEHEQEYALTFDATTALWSLVGNAEEFKRTKERQEIIDLLTGQLPEGMSPRQVAEALDKNYHTTRSLLRKMEDAGEVRHLSQQYIAIRRDGSPPQPHVSTTAPLHPASPTECDEEHAPSSTDYVDYTDYADYDVGSVDTDASVDGYTLSDVPETHELIPAKNDAPLESVPATDANLRLEVTVRQPYQNQDHAVISVINRNHCNQCNQRNQSELPVRPEPAPGRESQDGVSTDDETSKKELGAISVVNKARCPHHPYARWVRFDPSGQAWCDKMDCWDCYRLMKIGEALGYPHLLGLTRSTTIEQGKEAWASFVLSQGSFVVMAAIENAIASCKGLGIPEPDLSVEVQRLVTIRE